MIYEVKCIMCKEIHTLDLKEEDMKKWKEGAFIQAAFPYLNANERELLISRICGKCYDKIFG